MISVYISSKLYKEARLYNTVNNFKNFFTINMIMHVCDDEIQISIIYFYLSLYEIFQNVYFIKMKLIIFNIIKFRI